MPPGLRTPGPGSSSRQVRPTPVGESCGWPGRSGRGGRLRVGSGPGVRGVGWCWTRCGQRRFRGPTGRAFRPRSSLACFEELGPPPPTDCSESFSLRAASTTVVSPDSTLNTNRDLAFAPNTVGRPMVTSSCPGRPIMPPQPARQKIRRGTDPFTPSPASTEKIRLDRLSRPTPTSTFRCHSGDTLKNTGTADSADVLENISLQ